MLYRINGGTAPQANEFYRLGCASLSLYLLVHPLPRPRSSPNPSNDNCTSAANS
jgi:hypothetical protein